MRRDLARAAARTAALAAGVLAAAWTAADAVVTAAALPLVARADRTAALGLAPQAAWLGLATPVAGVPGPARPGPAAGLRT